MKTSAADQIYALLKNEALFDDEVAERLPSFSRNTIRRARGSLSASGKIIAVGHGRSPRYKVPDPS